MFFCRSNFDVIILNIVRVLCGFGGNQWNEDNGVEGHLIFGDLGPMYRSSSSAHAHEVKCLFLNFYVTYLFPMVLRK